MSFFKNEHVLIEYENSILRIIILQYFYHKK